MPPLVSRTICRSGIVVRHQTVHLCLTAPLWIELGEDRVQPYSRKELQFPFPVPVFTGAANLSVDPCPSYFLNCHILSPYKVHFPHIIVTSPLYLRVTFYYVGENLHPRKLLPSDIRDHDPIIRILSFNFTFHQLLTSCIQVKRIMHIGSRTPCFEVFW